MSSPETGRPTRNDGVFASKYLKGGATLAIMAAGLELANFGGNLALEEEFHVRAMQAMHRLDMEGLVGDTGHGIKNNVVQACLDTNIQCVETARKEGNTPANNCSELGEQLLFNPYEHTKCAYQEWKCLSGIEDGKAE